MKQITEDYVSYETAILLKEKGFDIPCREHYYQYGELSPYATEYDNWNNKNLDYFSCPSISLVMKWLREVYKMYIYIKPLEDGNCFSVHLLYNGIDKLIEGGAWGSYESAVEAALLYVLKNLI